MSESKVRYRMRAKTVVEVPYEVGRLWCRTLAVRASSNSQWEVQYLMRGAVKARAAKYMLRNTAATMFG
jgi:hypothetical protein